MAKEFGARAKRLRTIDEANRRLDQDLARLLDRTSNQAKSVGQALARAWVDGYGPLYWEGGMSDESGWQPRPITEVLGQLLPREEVAAEAVRLEAELPAIMGRFALGRDAAALDLCGMTNLLRTTEDTVERMASRRFFLAIWAKLTGHERTDKDRVRQNLLKVQRLAVVVFDRLLARQEHLLVATQYLGARLELLEMKQVELKAVLVDLGNRIMARVESLESRVDRAEIRLDVAERCTKMNEMFQSAYSPSTGTAYAGIQDPLERTLLMCRDFTDLAVRARPVDLARFRKLLKNDSELLKPRTIHEVIDLAANLPDDLAGWLGAADLGRRLMLPLSQGADEHRGQLPMHFLLLRPHWFIDQGFTREDLSVVYRQATEYGVDGKVQVTLDRVAQLVLEERIVWELESAVLRSPPTTANSHFDGTQTSENPPEADTASND
ncbi:MAG: hypothetical protein HN348_33130, partial [Proteobacteria bacterium]|nr:hypothetical protein [Pseudomonadota bacterium]